MIMLQVVLVVKNPPANAGNARDRDSISGFGRSFEEWKDNNFSILACKIPWTGELLCYTGAAESPMFLGLFFLQREILFSSNDMTIYLSDKILAPKLGN